MLILLWITVACASSLDGTWFFNINGSALQTDRLRATVVLLGQSGTFSDGNGTVTLANISTNAAILEFSRPGLGFTEWFRLIVGDGILTGRFSHEAAAAKPDLTAYRYVTTAWSPDVIDNGSLVPRSWDILTNTTHHGRIRIDRNPSGVGFVGRFKIYYVGPPDVPPGKWDGVGEEVELQSEVKVWDGTHLQFTRPLLGGLGSETYTGTVDGYRIAGTYTTPLAAGEQHWAGQRWAVLDYGLTPRSDDDRAVWQERTRLRLKQLMMMGDPLPVGPPQIVTQKVPLSGTAMGIHRDDNPAHHPQLYTMTEMNMTHTLPNPYGGPTLTRYSHGYLAVPTTPPPVGGRYPAALVLNGHAGSAWQMMYCPNTTIYWYGDAFARRGYIVFALDVSHRNDSEFYHDWHSEYGDDQKHGNSFHPSVKYSGLWDSLSDWEEDGERSWDAMRALDILATMPNVDPTRIVVSGLSMGGEITTFVGALDTRPAVIVPAGYSPDMDVVYHHGNHPCWVWSNSNIREMIDSSTLLALRAPKPAIVETGKLDFTYSNLLPSPFAADKQDARRARAAYSTEVANFWHYLHYDVHRWHAGDVEPKGNGSILAQMYVRVPVEIAPDRQDNTGWEISRDTFMPEGRDEWTLFEYLGAFLDLPSL